MVCDFNGVDILLQALAVSHFYNYNFNDIKTYML